MCMKLVRFVYVVQCPAVRVDLMDLAQMVETITLCTALRVTCGYAGRARKLDFRICR